MPRGTGLPSQAGSGAASSVQRGAKVSRKYVTLAAGQTRGRIPGRRYRIPAGVPDSRRARRDEPREPTIRVSKDRLHRSLRGTRAGHLAFGAGGRLTRHAKEMSRDHNDARHAAPTRRTTAAGRRQLARRSGPVGYLVYRNGRRPAGARAPAPDRPGADHRAYRGFDGAADRQGERGQYRVTGAGPAAGRPRLPGRRGLPGDQLPVRDAGLGPGRMAAAGRLQVKNAEHELACHLDLHLGGTRPDGSPCILITSSWIIDSRWITRQWIPGLGRRIVMTCSCSLQPDM
jgi:hypothetical protein